MDIEKYQDEETTPIQNFYANKNIFITGGTGFVGIILIEKLLRSCPNISTIYILIRGKKGKDHITRLNELLNNQVFERMKLACPDYKKKLIPIKGDCCFPNIGLSENDKKILISNVNVIFHVAATVRFNEKLKQAVDINVKGSLDIANIATEMKNLKSFVYVSTAYSNFILPTIEEKVYSSHISWKNLLAIVDNLPDKILDSITPQLLDRFPNTYCFTKGVAETIIAEKLEEYPAGIFRPSIILTAYREPLRGWTNNMYGVTAFFYAVACGILHAYYRKQDDIVDFVPVDMCVNGLIGVGWEIGTKFEKNEKKNNSNNFPVYFYNSKTDQPITWFQYERYIEKHGLKMPLKKCFYVAFAYFTKYRIIYLILDFFFHKIPAAIIDFTLICRGKQPKLLKIYRKIDFGLNMVYPFLHTFNFQSNRLRKMINNMTKKDREIFFCDLKHISWDEAILWYVKGIRLYLFHEDDDTIPEGLAKHKRWTIINNIIITTAALLILSSIWSVLSFFYRLVT